MMPEQDKNFGASTKFLLGSLDGVPTYQYMKYLNLNLNFFLSEVDCTLVCGTLGYHYGMAFLPPTDLGIHSDMPDPAPTAAILSTLARNHNHKVRLYNKYHAVDWVCMNIISQLIPEKYYKSLSSRIIGFAKSTCFQILTHLITEYTELEDDDIQEIDQRMKEMISG